MALARSRSLALSALALAVVTTADLAVMTALSVVVQSVAGPVNTLLTLLVVTAGGLLLYRPTQEWPGHRAHLTRPRDAPGGHEPGRVPVERERALP